MLTTRESINYQFSIIFGYSSPNDLFAGDIIGPGKLTKEKLKELSNSVINFLRMYNAMLRDYTGSEVFSIEFSLYNKNEHSSSINIYPKSMILIPGNYKDCQTLLLALKPETGILNTHKSRETLLDISKIFFEVEEFSNHPELNSEEKEQLLDHFASRFSLKLYGDLLEDKWNKKIIGLSTYLPTEREMLTFFAEISAKVELLWYKRPYEIKVINPKLERIETPFKDQSAIDHLKFSISEPSANFVIENTLKLGTNLMNLANIGSIDESQNEIIIYIFNFIEEKIKLNNDLYLAKDLISENKKILNELERFFNKFLEYSQNFLTSGELGNLDEILKKYEFFILKKGKLENEDFKEFCLIANNSFKHSIIHKDNYRAIDLESVIYYFSEIFKNSLNIIKNALPTYLSRRRLIFLTRDLIEKIRTELVKEKKPVRILGNKYVDKFKIFLLNQIEVNPLLSKNLKFNEDNLISEFLHLVKEGNNSFFDNMELNISELISFAEELMEKNPNIIKTHLDKFKKFSGELHFLLSYLLRYSTINRYLKEESDEEISDPVTFANRFHRFLEKRTGGINLVWKNYILEWINDYAKKFFKLEEQKEWDLKEIYTNFIQYFEDREFREQQIEKFLEFLDEYIAKIVEENEKEHLLDFFKQYDFCLKNKSEFPKYIKEIIKKVINSSNIQLEELNLIKYIKSDETNTFHNYLKDEELRYFSQLIPQPISLILKHNLTNKEKELFKADLFHVFNFQFWGKNNVKIRLADNFKEVYSEWVKEI